MNPQEYLMYFMDFVCFRRHRVRLKEPFCSGLEQ